MWILNRIKLSRFFKWGIFLNVCAMIFDKLKESPEIDYTLNVVKINGLVKMSALSRESYSTGSTSRTHYVVPNTDSCVKIHRAIALSRFISYFIFRKFTAFAVHITFYYNRVINRIWTWRAAMIPLSLYTMLLFGIKQSMSITNKVVFANKTRGAIDILRDRPQTNVSKWPRNLNEIIISCVTQRTFVLWFRNASPSRFQIFLVKN